MEEPMKSDDGVVKRRAVVAGLAGAATLAAIPLMTHGDDAAARGKGESKPDPAGSGKTVATKGRMPVAYIPHGGGPWPFVDVGMSKADKESLTAYLKAVRALPRTTPKALLVVSAHWEESVPTVMTNPKPPLFFDYYGFPPESYKLTWPAPGDPALAARVRELLAAAGMKSGADDKRGFDHGTFIPLKLTYPEADIPTIQLSLRKGLDPGEHVAIGRAIAPLRDEGVFILGSGMSFHNMAGFGDPRARATSVSFDNWLKESVSLDEEARDKRLREWASAPEARRVHPREEHLLPLMVVAGAAGADRGAIAYNGDAWGVKLSAVHFG